MGNIFSLARAGANLTPGERAFVKLVEGWLIVGLGSALLALGTELSSPHPDWPTTLKYMGVAFATATLFAAVKYFKAQGDAPLASALDTLAKGISDYGNKPAMVPAGLPPVNVNTGTSTVALFTTDPTATGTVQ